jgi:hypothetical protein
MEERNEEREMKRNEERKGKMTQKEGREKGKDGAGTVERRRKIKKILLKENEN